MTRDFSRTAVGMLAILASAAMTQARDYGQYSFIPQDIKAWIEHLTNDMGQPCCAIADGSVPDVWEMGLRHYRVKIYGQWLDVPDDAVVKGPNRLGHALVWVDVSEGASGGEIGVRCFLPGPET